MQPAIRVLLSGICHQLPEHSYWIDGQPLPLCARCSGTFLGLWIGLLALRLMGRHRRTEFPAIPAMWILVAMVSFWALDGLNSTVAMALQQSLYAPSNACRLLSGAGMGVALSSIIAPMMALAFGTDKEASPSVHSLCDAGTLVAAAAIAAAMLHFGGWLPHAGWSLILGILVVSMIALLNAILAKMIAPKWHAWAIGGTATFLALVEMGAIATLRRLVGV